MEKHTPGPWFANESEMAARASLVSIRTKNGAYEITKDVGYQNARLIAAAPDLLAALKLIAERPRSKPTVPQDIVTIQRIARAAIAKAEGN